ncbi:MAG TPA: Ku protein [Actinomycetota bacterium]|nr:Ku protein [Actinomycetota bacterium]
MPTAVWTGTISFGLVAVPVRLIPATEPKDVRFHLYDRSGRRVRYERIVEGSERAEPDAADAEPAEPAEPESEASLTEPERTGPHPPIAEPTGPVSEPLAWEDVVRGRENEFGEVVMLSREELEQARPQRSRTIDIEDFVELSDIDPVSFEKTYYAVPQSLEAAKPYVLLHRAMREADRAGIGRFVLRTKPHLVAVRPMQDVLAVETLFFGDEVRDPSAFVPGLDGLEVDERELELAIRLIDTLKTEWDPSAYADTYREELLRILSEKSPTAAPAETATAAAADGPSAVEELMTALRESVEAAKAKADKRGSRSKRAG